jgi:HSP20 family protein
MALLPTLWRNRGRSLGRPLDDFRDELDTMFQRFFGGWMAPFEDDTGHMRVWDFDVTENDKEITVRAEIPGFEDKDLDVQLIDNLLTIKAEKKEETNESKSYRSFRRTVTLSPGIDPNKVQATYKNGVLELHIPRPEGAKTKKISIKSS